MDDPSSAEPAGRRRVPTVDSQTVTIAGSVPPSVRARAIELAAREGTTMSKIVVKALETYLKVPTDEELDELDRIRKQLEHRFATANQRRLLAVCMSSVHNDVELVFEGLPGEGGELLLTIPLAGPPSLGSISLDGMDSYGEQRQTPLDEVPSWTM